MWDHADGDFDSGFDKDLQKKHFERCLENLEIFTLLPTFYQ